MRSAQGLRLEPHRLLQLRHHGAQVPGWKKAAEMGCIPQGAQQGVLWAKETVALVGQVPSPCHKAWSCPWEPGQR